ncbi:hypothetical protein J8I82_37095 [Cupriavidus sp. LEh25]|nr:MULTISPECIES: hypothetical protein [unclassified Cupriavidus]MBP0625413.1 hypothetical protein [Cupriavidus sp. LEh25]MDK2662154.1 hypothetical protein [Cupriavidus sp. LEh21]
MPDTALHGQNTTITGWLYMAFELSDKSWKQSLGDELGPSRHTLGAGDLNAVLQVIAKAKAHCGLAPQAPVRSCYEAGRARRAAMRVG